MQKALIGKKAEETSKDEFEDEGDYDSYMEHLGDQHYELDQIAELSDQLAIVGERPSLLLCRACRSKAIDRAQTLKHVRKAPQLFEITLINAIRIKMHDVVTDMPHLVQQATEDYRFECSWHGTASLVAASGWCGALELS